MLGLDRGQDVSPLPDFEPLWCVLAIPETGVSTPQAFRDWDALCAADGLTAEASADKLKELSRAYASAFAGCVPQGGQGTGSSGVPTSGRGPGRTRKSPRLSAPGSLAGSRTTSNRSCFPSIPPCVESSRYSCGRRHTGGSPPCLAVGVRFSALRPLPGPEPSRSSRRKAAGGGSRNAS